MTSAGAPHAAQLSPAPALPAGFAVATASAAIKKPGRTDMALLRCPGGATLAAVYTTNQVCAAPVQRSRQHLAMSHGHCGALLLNSGCANAATGARGMANAVELMEAVARACDLAPEAVQHNSTGVIGVQLPMERMLPCVPVMAAAAAHGSVEPLARAIMTTDTAPKWAARSVAQAGAHGQAHAQTHSQAHVGRTCSVVGVAKGAGMIHPNMATMIAVLMTDAAVEPPALDALLRHAVERSFHRISIDGDTSTNDSVFALASGEAGSGFAHADLQQAFDQVARDLAMMVVRDGEGYERGIHVRVTGAPTSAEALLVAKTIASSLLVRCAVTGGDPNWGRILAAAGRSGVRLSLDECDLRVGGVPLFAHGAPADTPLAQREAAFRAPLVEVDLCMGPGPGQDEFTSCGLTKAYVELNAEYTT
ncbi:MAG: bifunctional glutamate N-acetyltransferase/amino-acid acetyltransferase ArgJ [Phycisphaerales bacterium]